MRLIIPVEKRVLVYSVLNEKIINIEQQSNYPHHFRVKSKLLNETRKSCIDQTSKTENLLSIVYVHQDGSLEIEINVSRPKYGFHPNYNHDNMSTNNQMEQN
jgi:hypothetical protein